MMRRNMAALSNSFASIFHRRSSLPVLVLSLALTGAATAGAVSGCTTTVTPSGDSDAGTDSGTTTDSGSTPIKLEGLRDDWRERAGGYLEMRSDKWVKSPPKISNVPCAMSCHTTFPYSLARHSIATKMATPAGDAARAAFEARVALGAGATPFYGKDGDAKTKESLATEALLNGVSLAMDEVWSKKALSAQSKAAFERMWATQSADGTWAWLEFKLEPWETRNDFGAAMAIMVLGSIPADSTPSQAANTAKVVSYVKSRLTTMAFHDRVITLWASSFMKDALTAEERDGIAAQIVAKQLEDGGFSAGGWGKGALASDVASISDGYATAIAALALCGEPSRKAETQKALAWLGKSQAEDGSWPGQSVNVKDAQNRTFMTDAATAYAVLALTHCAGL